MALEISYALGESLSVVQAQYFRDNDVLRGFWRRSGSSCEVREDWDKAQV
jgi:hypothetical protein